MGWRRTTSAWALLVAVTALIGAAPPRASGEGLKLDRVVILMRHGVRPPTKAPAMPPRVTPDRWPDWPVPPGWLTPHGARAIGALGRYDSMQLRKAGLLPHSGCPRAGAITIIADSDQRTIATAENWARGLAPKCAIAIQHRPQDDHDPLFSPGSSLPPLDRARAQQTADAAAGRGGIAALDAEYRPLLRRLDAILCSSRKAACGVGVGPTKVVYGGPKPKLSGPLDLASTAAQILLLEYANGKPMADVGWGRATRADITALSAFHALEFRLLARPPYFAARNLALLVPRIDAALASTSPDAPAVTMISGHDTNVASLGGLLDVHWTVPGFAIDDPAPGGALLLERLSDARGNHFVRAVYRAQTLDQIRAGARAAVQAPMRRILPIPDCRAKNIVGLCTLAEFQRKLRRH